MADARAQSDLVIDAGGVEVAGDRLLVHGTKSALAVVRSYALDGTDMREIELPGPVSLAGFDADEAQTQAFLQLESFALPATLHRWTPADGIERWGTSSSPVDADRFHVEQVRYPSTDGVDVPMFLVRRADVTPSPDTPCLLTGYGGFSIAATPAYSPIAIAVAEAGGMFADACIRGGAEEGEDWHRAGMREHKQQVFDDFHAAGDWLVSNEFTSRARLALRGGSNGGLLMGAAMTQRPDLARAIHCAVPLLDMVRYHLHLIGKLWTPEYGDPEVAEELEWVLAYSPYHHVVPGTCYPAVLFTAAEGDGRVDPNHARKMTAAVQWATVVWRRASNPAEAGGSSRPRRGQAAREAGRRAGRRPRVLVVAAGPDLDRIGMTGSPTIAELVVGASPDHWRAAGFAVDADNRVVIGTVTIRARSRQPIQASRLGRCALRCHRRSTASRRRPRRPTSPTRPCIRTTSSRSTTSSCSPPTSIARSTHSPSKGSSCAASAKAPRETDAR